jgi:hypothetical protein
MRSLTCVLALTLAACGSSSTPGAGDGGHHDGGTADAPTIDATPPDAPPIDATPPNPLGMDCPTGTECPAGFTCLDEADGFPGNGYCTRGCLDDAECGADAFCGPDLGGGRFCLPTCASCTASNRVCSPALNGFYQLPMPACIPGDPSAHDGHACNTFGDCNAHQACLDNPFDLPNGYCITTGCTVGDNTTCATGGDGVCIPLGGGGATGCLDGCTTTSDCRSTEGYTCDTVAMGTNVCFYDHRRPGNTCTTATDCGAAPWQCLTGTAFPGGYCGFMGCDPADASTCPFNTTCYDPTPGSLDGTEYCARTCMVDSDCTGAAINHEHTTGYTCQASQPGAPNTCRH